MNLTTDVSGCFVVEDNGYDSNEHRKNLRLRGNITVIPGRKNRKETIKYDKNHNYRKFKELWGLYPVKKEL